MNGDFGKVGERGPDVRIIDILFLCTIPYPYQLLNYLRVDTHRVEKGIWNGLKSKLAYAIWISPELTCQFSRRELIIRNNNIVCWFVCVHPGWGRWTGRPRRPRNIRRRGNFFYCFVCFFPFLYSLLFPWHLTCYHLCLCHGNFYFHLHCQYNCHCYCHCHYHR